MGLATTTLESGHPILPSDRRPTEAPTVTGLVRRFLEDYLPNKKRPPRESTIVYYESLLRCHVLPRLGTKRVDAITRDDLEQLHVSMRDKPYIANRTVTVLRHAFDQTEVWGWRPQHSNPATHIERYREERRGAKKEVMLTAAQMRELLEAVDEEEKVGRRSRDELPASIW